MSSQQTSTMRATESELQLLDLKLASMTHNVGVTLSEREVQIIRSAMSGGASSEGSPSTLPSSSVADVDQVIDEMVEPGMCWIQLFRLLPSLSKMSPAEVLQFIQGLKQTLGAEPLGKSVLLELVMIETSMASNEPISDVPDDVSEFEYKHILALKEIHKNTSERLNYVERAGLVHLTYGGRCNHEDILCSHGWAARFIVCMLSRDGCKVGASDIDFSALFNNNEPPVSPLNIKPASEDQAGDQGMNNELRTARKEERDFDRDMVSVMGDHLEKRTELLMKTIERLSIATSSKNVMMSDDDEQTIRPSDSSSVLERYIDGRRFIKQGTIFEPEISVKKTENTGGTAPSSSSFRADLVSGYVMTPELQTIKNESESRVTLLNGLAAPFKNGRLNFLTHFHTSLSECHVDSRLEPLEALIELGQRTSDNTSGELVRQSISVTFDFQRMVVCSNPFRFPFVEIGMQVTDSVVIKLLSLLEMEYKSLWFQEMKCLKVPRFHSEFNKVSTSTRSFQSTSREKRRTSSSSRSSASSEASNGTRSSKSTTRSFLGLN